LKKKPLMGKGPAVGVLDHFAHRRPPAVGAESKEILGGWRRRAEVVAGSAVRLRNRAGEGSNRPRRER